MWLKDDKYDDIGEPWGSIDLGEEIAWADSGRHATTSSRNAVAHSQEPFEICVHSGKENKQN